MGVADIVNSPEARVFASSLASTYGMSPDAAQSAMASLLPTLISGLEANTLSKTGIADLMEALSSGHHQNVIDNPALVSHPDTIADGNAVIGHLLGPGGLSQGTLQAAARQSGVPPEMLGNIAPALAVFLLGWLFRNGGGMLGSVLGSAMGGTGGGGFSVPQMPRAGTGGGMMPPLPDLRNLGPGSNPYGNIADVIRNSVGGGAAAGGVRDILGGLLGFGSSRGIVGWIIRYLVLRFGMSIVRSLLRNVIRGI